MSKRIALFAVVVAIGVGLAAGVANAGLVTVVSSSNPPADSTLDFTALGTTDWLTFSSGALYQKAGGGGGAVGILQWGSDFGGGSVPVDYNSGAPVSLTWTDGTAAMPTSAGWTGYRVETNSGWAPSARAGVYAPITTTDNYTLTAVISSQYVGNGGYVDEWVSDTPYGAAVASGTTIWVTGGTWLEIQVVFSGDVGQYLNIGVSGNGGAPNYGNSMYQTIEGAALSLPGVEIPEPATVLLVGTGALGVFGFIRRQRMK